MVMIKLERAREIAEGEPDLSSVDFRNAVATARARSRVSASHSSALEAQEILALLLAHGEPTAPPKRSPEEISQIRREAGHGARRATCKAALRRKLAERKGGFASVTDRKPAVFDAALEMIEDGEVSCIFQTVQTVYQGPISEGGRVPVRTITVALPDARMPCDAKPRECQWKSRRRQAEEDRI